METLPEPATERSQSIRDVLEQNMQDGTAIRQALQELGEQNPHLLHAVLAISQDRENMMDRQELIAFTALVATEERRKSAANELCQLVNHEVSVDLV